MKTVLFAWELGAGSGHLMNIRRLAQRLRSQDVRVIAAVTRLDSISALDDVVTEIHRLPNWPVATVDPRTGAAPSSATMNDMLVTAGLADTAGVQQIVAAWDRLFRKVNPDLVIAEYAPAATLAARHRIPLMLIGNGFTLPPHEMEEFPPLHSLSPPVHRDADTLAAINAALGNIGLRKLDRLPQLFAGDAHLVHTLPVLDPYASRRQTQADGPLIDYVPRARTADAQQVLVYISQGVEVRSDVAIALQPIAARVRIHAPMLTEDARNDLARGGARIEQAPVDLSQALPQCRLVVHLGGNGLAAEAVLAGVPQFTLVTHVEQHLTGIALERAGAGRLFTAYDRAQALPANAIKDMVDDKNTEQGAAGLGSLQRTHCASGAVFEVFDRACARLLR